MVGNIKQKSSSSSINNNMLRYLPHYFFLVLALASRPASSASYKVVLEGASAQDFMTLKCYNYKEDIGYKDPRGPEDYYWYLKFGEPVEAYFESWQHMICGYWYQDKDLHAGFVLFNGDRPDEDCRANLGGCTFLIKDAVMYKKLRSGGTRVIGDLKAEVCKDHKLLWFTYTSCKEKPHQHPYVASVA